jgi:hypothetical protein
LAKHGDGFELGIDVFVRCRFDEFMVEEVGCEV